MQDKYESDSSEIYFRIGKKRPRVNIFIITE